MLKFEMIATKDEQELLNTWTSFILIIIAWILISMILVCKSPMTHLGSGFNSIHFCEIY
ncbi:MAG: hypothetical protein K9G57_02550 [Ignavibacteriales bacterium]|nr:hypothetical protein [Ignavibacteriales bacterium]